MGSTRTAVVSSQALADVIRHSGRVAELMMSEGGFALEEHWAENKA
jgi:RNA:NAD 2'-phosphotransferase (TPT1/KptA family)